MKSQAYWAQRQRMLEEVRHKQNTEYLRQLDKAFAIERRNIENQILSWYERLADNNGVSLAEAKRMLSAKELKEFRWTVEEYIKYGQENAINQQWLKELENASAKAHIDRLQALEIELRQKVERIYHEYGKSVSGLFTGQMKELYAEASKISGVDLAFDTRKAKSVLSKPWTSDGKTFSERIWGRKEELHRHLHTEMTRMCITGETPKRLIENLEKKFGVEKYRAKALVNTESSYFASVTQGQIYDDLDVEKYQVLAQVDDDTTETCLELNGQVFEVKDFEPGTTAPPFHPNCRTITAPWFSEDEGFENFDITEKGKYEKLNFNKDEDEYVNRIAHEFSTQRLTVKELRHLWDKDVGYIQTAGYADINRFMRGEKSQLDNPRRRITINVLKRVTNNNALVKDYIGVRKVDTKFLEEVMQIDTQNLIKHGVRKDGMGRLRSQKIPKDRQSAQKIVDSINSLVGTPSGVITDKAFTSVSLDESLNYFSHYPIKFEIQMDKGTKGLITNNNPESELILKDNTSIEIIGSKVYNDGGDDCILIYGKVKQ